jgi:hypothetical protein
MRSGHYTVAVAKGLLPVLASVLGPFVQAHPRVRLHITTARTQDVITVICEDLAACGLEGHAGVQCLQRKQSGHPQLCAVLGARLEGGRCAGECAHARSDLHSGFAWFGRHAGTGTRAGFGADRPNTLGSTRPPRRDAAAALFLACDDSRCMTGSEVFVDGGVAQI